MGRPVGYADTPLDDQQAMLGLHWLCCFVLLLDKAVPPPDAQCNKKVCSGGVFAT